MFEDHSCGEISKDLINELCDRISKIQDESPIPDKLFVYRWPVSSQERYVMLDQFCLFLKTVTAGKVHGIAAIDLPRRLLNADERNFIAKHKNRLPADLNLASALVLKYKDALNYLIRSQSQLVECFEQDTAVVVEPEVEKHETAKVDLKKLNELKMKAIKNAADWNSENNRIKRQERGCFFEPHTMSIQYPKYQTAAKNTNFGEYPVALIPGQYQSYYRRYTSKELFRLPVNTVLDTEGYKPLRKCPSPEPIVVLDSDFQKTQDKSKDKSHSKSPRRSGKSGTNIDTKTEPNKNCAFCCEEIKIEDKYVKCSKCDSCGHPNCMEMSDEMLLVTKSYSWMCMECKPCSICAKLDGEDKMLFCDRCDRGYHTFCVGLQGLPSGRWICPAYCQSSTSTTPKQLNFSCLAPPASAEPTGTPPSDRRRVRKRKVTAELSPSVSRKQRID